MMVLKITILLLLVYGRFLAGTILEPCRFQESELSASCLPCNKSDWLEMVKPSSGDEEITNAEKTCYNNDPVKVGPNNDGTDVPVLVSAGEYRITANHGPRGFLLRKEPFFRYAYIDNSSATSGPGGSEEKYLDLNEVKKYYRRYDHAGNFMDADFQMLEWPGATADVINTYLNSNFDQFGGKCEGTNSHDVTCRQQKQWMLDFERDNGKILHYPCNKGAGTNIAVVASIIKTDYSKLNPFVESAQQIWLAHGNKTFFDSYIQPLYAPQYVLEQMARAEGYLCKKEEIDCVGNPQANWCIERCLDLYNESNCYVPRNGSTFSTNEIYTFGDLRIVHDFTFTRDRLVLGMKCGIMIVSGWASDLLTFKAAYLQSETQLGYNLFPGPINRVSASTCCTSPKLCGSGLGGLVAAYSFDRFRLADEDKFLYVSFDLGDTFQKRIVTSSFSPINLIKGLFKLYDRWHDYYEILHNPDSHDLRDEKHDELLQNLRGKPTWHTSTTEEKEKLFSIGTRSDKKRATLKKIVQILEERVPKRRARLGHKDNEDLAPDWANEIFNKRRKDNEWLDTWTDENCDSNVDCIAKFENDRVVEWLLKDAGIHIKTPRRKENEPFCKEIVSMIALPEEKHIMALCEIGYDKVDVNSGIASTQNQTNPLLNEDFGYYAVYNFPIKESVPLIYGYRVSQRIFTCKYIKNTINPDPKKQFIVQPIIVRIPSTSAIMILNCDGVIYLSTNFGNTLFNMAFYYEHERIEKFCQLDSNYVSPTPTNRSCEGSKNRPAGYPQYVRSFKLCALNVPPIFSTDATGYSILLTFGKYYAYGAIAYNRETRLVVGEVLREMEFPDRFENLLYPSIDRNGETVLAVALARAYSIPPTIFKTALYARKHSLRLIRMPFQYNRDARHFYNGNLGMCTRSEKMRFGIPKCMTSSYAVYPKRLDMDIGEQESVQIAVQDEDPFLPLWIFSSNENSIEVKAYHSLREGSPIPGLSMHNWKVDVKAIANSKNEEDLESQVDAFFGSDYNKLNEYSTQISFVNRPNARCHVRPSSLINVKIGCRGKKLVAHEDSYRPQCKLFRQKLNYTLRRGKYDPELANLWKATASNRSRNFYKIDNDGDLHVTYDYVNWGCPLEPFRTDAWVPDLRIVDETAEETSSGVRFEGRFVLIEILGTIGFSYKRKVKDMDCNQKPQNLQEMLTQWKYRQRIFHLASNRLKFPRSSAELNLFNYSSSIRGNMVLQNAAVLEHINIWNRANYVSCYNSSKHELLKSDLERSYEIMKTRELDEDDVVPKVKTIEELDAEELADDDDEDDVDDRKHYDKFNEIVWHKDHPRVFLFMAIAVDEYDSFCDFVTMFGVSLKTVPDMDDLYSFLIFLGFLVFWFILVVGGYHVRKRYLRITFLQQATAERLEQAAWTIVYRYEKLIHGNAMDALFHTESDAPADPGAAKLNLAAKNAHDKRRAELRMKKTHIMAQEAAKAERLAKIFQKQ